MKTLKAFYLGIVEFSSSWTTHFCDYNLQESYDKGRELAHRLTLRRFEQ